MSLALSAAALIVAIAAPRVARADAMPGPRLGWYLPAGVVIAGATHADGAGFVGGAEVSLVRVEIPVWAGIYVDAVGDTGAEAFRMSVGPEVGFAIFGVDGGFLLQGSEAGWDPGFTARGMLTLSALTLYGRYGRFPGAPGEPSFGEFGLLAKYPFELCAVRKGPEPDWSACPF